MTKEEYKEIYDDIVRSEEELKELIAAHPNRFCSFWLSDEGNLEPAMHPIPNPCQAVIKAILVKYYTMEIDERTKRYFPK